MSPPFQLESIPCPDYPFSNDCWSNDQASKLRQLLAKQHGDRERATGLVVGAGGLPYILGYLGVSRIVLLDKSPAVIESVQRRVELLQEANDWQNYQARLLPSLSRLQQARFAKEIVGAKSSGLLADFALTCAGASATEIKGHSGDIINELPNLARELTEEDRVVSFANFTNIGTWLQDKTDSSVRAGRRGLARLARELPFAEGAVIVESVPDTLQVTVRPAAEFFNHWKGSK